MKSFEQYRAERIEAARREAVARKIETGVVRLMGTDAKGRPLTLGTQRTI